MPTSSSISPPREEDVCAVCGGAGFVVPKVPVGHPDFQRLRPCRCRQAELQRRYQAELYRVSNLGHLARMTFESFEPDGVALDANRRFNLRGAYEKARAFADNPQGWLVLLGGYGCGKTHLAAAIANERLTQGKPVLFVVVPDLLDHLRATFSPTSDVTYDAQFDKVRNAPLLILDDLGTESSTPWAQEKLFQILNYRYSARLPTVITSNHKLEEIEPRLRSRLVDVDVSVIVTILAPDFRGSDVGCGATTHLSSLVLHGDQTFENFNLKRAELGEEDRANLERAYQIAVDFAECPDQWLVLSGPYGCGKTHLAAAIANRRVSRGYPALFVVVPDLLDHLRATFNPNSTCTYDRRFEEVKTAPLLILDDLGTESATTWAREKLYQLFNYRYNAHLPTVITTSDRPDDIEPRLRTRMLDELRCTFFAITAPSYRGGLHQTETKPLRSPRRRRP
mgnify:CR=1 FL=1